MKLTYLAISRIQGELADLTRPRAPHPRFAPGEPRVAACKPPDYEAGSSSNDAGTITILAMQRRPPLDSCRTVRTGATRSSSTRRTRARGLKVDVIGDVYSGTTGASELRPFDERGRPAISHFREKPLKPPRKVSVEPPSTQRAPRNSPCFTGWDRRTSRVDLGKFSPDTLPA